MNGGQLNIINNSLIEDASVAVNINGHTSTSQILKVENSIFNKNSTGIFIQNYNQSISTAPFSVTNSLFTCRNISYCSSFLNWPSTSTVKAANNQTSSPLETPYIKNSNYPVTTIIGTNSKPLYGIRLLNVGKTNIVSSPIYYEIILGDNTGSNTYNLFDNHLWAIFCNNSNLTVNNTIFQNGTDLSASTYARGVWAISNYPYNNRLLLNSTGAYSNKFYNVTRAVRAEGFFDLDFSNCEVYNTKIYNPSANFNSGTYGLSAQTNRYIKVTANNNKIYNIDNAIDFRCTVGQYAIGKLNAVGQYLGSINADNNIIRTHLPGYTPATQFGYRAISLTGIFSATTTLIPNSVVTTNNNIITDYQNGISCSEWNPMGVISKANTITLRNASTNTYQYGIEHVHNTLYPNYSFKQYGIVENNVTANAVSTFSNNYAIRSVQNTNYAVVCNTVSNTYNGLSFDGYHPNNAFVRFNNMQSNRQGFVLANQGVIGSQGQLYPDGSATFADNQWLGSWIAPNYKTACLDNSNASLSKMCVRNSSSFNPNGSSISLPLAQQFEYGITNGSILIATVEGTFYNCFLTKPAPTGNNISEMEYIASQNAPNGLNHAIARFVAKNQLFTYLQNNPDAKQGSGILTGFYNSNKHNYRGTFFDVETKAAEGDRNTALNEVNAFNPQNHVETKHKKFYELMFKHQNQTLTTTDEQEILTIAEGCPYLDGTVVHQARALYNLATDQNRVFMDNCDYILASNNRLSKSTLANYEEEEGLSSDNILLFPNPASGEEINIALANTDVESIEATITNANGLFIAKQTVAINNGIGKLNLKASNGVYMVTFVNPKTNERVIKKLVINK